MKRIACISQKGGVGKSTLARDFAVQFAANNWRVRLADLDARQSTASIWQDRRAGTEPKVKVDAFASAEEAVKVNGCDVVIYDGKPYSDLDTRRIAEVSDLLVIPTGPTVDDLHPQVLLAHELVKARIPKEKVLFVLNSVSSDLGGSEVAAAKAYLREAGYQVAEAVIPRRTAYGQAQNAGRSISEVQHASLRVHPVALMEEVVGIILGKV